MTFVDIEYIIVFLLLCIFLIHGFKRQISSVNAINNIYDHFTIDKNYTTIIKGIACIFILMGHFGQRNFDTDLPWGVSRVVQNFTANIALVWFMYFSGYGLTLKWTKTPIAFHFRGYVDRFRKIYIPLLVVSIITIVVYIFIPNNEYVASSKLIEVPEVFHFLKEINSLTVERLIKILEFAIGGFDWYVCCILIFYALFYLSAYYDKKYGWHISNVLGLLMLLYIIIAFKVAGWSNGHYFRFPCAFLFGHCIAMGKNKKKIGIVLLALSFLWVIYLRDVYIIASYVIAIGGIYFFAWLNRNYVIDEKSPLIKLGLISYPFYLCHCRISYPIMIAWGGQKSVILWILITIMTSILFYKFLKLAKVS